MSYGYKQLKKFKKNDMSYGKMVLLIPNWEIFKISMEISF